MTGPQRPASGLPTRRTTAQRIPTRRTTGRSDSLAVPAKQPTTSASRAPKSPADPPSVTSKRKERDFEREINEDTSIHVVVRCRGRDERETKESSGVVVSTEGIKSQAVNLSMGPNAVANKTYTFDKVFSPAADQNIVYDDVVLPIVNEVIHLVTGQKSHPAN